MSGTSSSSPSHYPCFHKNSNSFNPILYGSSTAPVLGADFGNGLVVDEVDALRDGCRQNGVSEIKCDKHKYQILLDVQHFKPEELVVKILDNCVTVEGHHDEKQDAHGFIIRSFKRRYILPEDVKTEKIQCLLSSDGILKFEAPRLPAKHLEDPTKETTIPVIETGLPAKSLIVHHAGLAGSRKRPRSSNE